MCAPSHIPLRGSASHQPCCAMHMAGCYIAEPEPALPLDGGDFVILSAPSSTGRLARLMLTWQVLFVSYSGCEVVACISGHPILFCTLLVGLHNLNLGGSVLGYPSICESLPFLIKSCRTTPPCQLYMIRFPNSSS